MDRAHTPQMSRGMLITTKGTWVKMLIARIPQLEAMRIVDVEVMSTKTITGEYAFNRGFYSDIEVEYSPLKLFIQTIDNPDRQTFLVQKAGEIVCSPEFYHAVSDPAFEPEMRFTLQAEE